MDGDGYDLQNSNMCFRTKGPISEIILQFKSRAAISHTNESSELRLSHLVIT